MTSSERASSTLAIGTMVVAVTTVCLPRGRDQRGGLLHNHPNRDELHHLHPDLSAESGKA
jgi:hypothetical protein